MRVYINVVVADGRRKVLKNNVSNPLVTGETLISGFLYCERFRTIARPQLGLVKTVYDTSASFMPELSVLSPACVVG
jgi:hypothetical protein